jgi:hypothetical protein
MLRRQVLQGGLALIGMSKAASAQDLRLAPSELERTWDRAISILDYFCRGPTYTRSNIYSLLLFPNHPIIQSYSQGVAAMKAVPDDDPTSWAYQANIHKTLLPSSQWPANAPFNTCQHGTLFFLSWHRMYVYFFERIIRAASKNPDFALPYWDYGQAGQAALPPPFRNTASPLFDPTRFGNVNAGTPLLPGAVTASLSTTTFLGFQSTLEITPHGTVHSSIGGNMGTFPGAGRDPIFWLHHCNIDRLWEKWLSQGGGRANPTGNSSWMDQEFTFVDENKNFVTLTGAEIIFTVSQLRYQYADPRQCIPGLFALVQPAARTVRVSAEREVLESFLIAQNVAIPPERARIDLRVEAPKTRERIARALSPDRLAAIAQEDTAVTLTFEGVRTEKPLDGYFEIYIDLPPDVEPDFTLPYYAGNLAMFGADIESRRSTESQHAGHGRGLRVELDVTNTLRQVAGRGDTEREGLLVTLVPVGVAQDRGTRFRFNPEANPQIDAVVLNLVRGT